jgi:hypothetical protein
MLAALIRPIFNASAPGSCTASRDRSDCSCSTCSPSRDWRRRRSRTLSGALLEELDVEGPRVRLVATFEDGEAVFAAARGLEGVVGKRVRRPLPAG